MIDLRRQPTLMIRNFIDGYKLTYLGTSSVSVSAGMCANPENSAYIELSTPLTVNISGIAANTTYHIYVKDNNGTTEAFASTLSSIAQSRRVGSVVTDGSSNIRNFVQNGDSFYLNVPYLSINQAGTLATVSPGCPSGIKTEVFGQVGASQTADNSAQAATMVECPDVTGASIDFVTGSIQAARYGFGGGRLAGDFGSAHMHGSFIRVLTNSSGQIRIKNGNASVNMCFYIIGWNDPRGKE